MLTSCLPAFFNKSRWHLHFAKLTTTQRVKACSSLSGINTNQKGVSYLLFILCAGRKVPVLGQVSWWTPALSAPIHYNGFFRIQAQFLLVVVFKGLNSWRQFQFMQKYQAKERKNILLICTNKEMPIFLDSSRWWFWQRTFPGFCTFRTHYHL